MVFFARISNRYTPRSQPDSGGWICLFLFIFSLFGCHSADFKQARSLEDKGKLDEAEKLYLKVIAADEGSWWSSLPFIQEESVSAGRQLMQCSEIRSSALAEDEELKEIAIRTRHLAALIAVAQKNISGKSYSKKLSKYLMNISWIYFARLDYAGAESTLQQAQSVYTFPEIYYTLGLMAWLQGNHEEARRLFQRTLEVDDRYIRAQEALTNMPATR
ncbi:tetratricopeptide repeat protein [candidate division CSSED10-310 bacterium]|uniref:Tetratricopeptide repeat protein n=1 Tax=candidate division CSSED10-310 bacterium TaxID=2855610 RepID=A0ABV6YSC2_UNCC1